MKTVNELLQTLPAWYAEHTNENTVYNTHWHDYEWTDYSIEILFDGYEVRHSGNAILFQDIEDVLEYIS